MSPRGARVVVEGVGAKPWQLCAAAAALAWIRLTLDVVKRIASMTDGNTRNRGKGHEPGDPPR